MSKIKMVIELEYDADIILGGSIDAKDWFFNDILLKDKLVLFSNEIGDDIGIVTVIDIL